MCGFCPILRISTRRCWHLKTTAHRKWQCWMCGHRCSLRSAPFLVLTVSSVEKFLYCNVCVEYLGLSCLPDSTVLCCLILQAVFFSTCMIMFILTSSFRMLVGSSPFCPSSLSLMIPWQMSVRFSHWFSVERRNVGQTPYSGQQDFQRQWRKARGYVLLG